MELPLSNDLKNRNLITNGMHLPYSPRSKTRARVHRNNMTPEERFLWYGFLRKHPLRFLRQKSIDHFILDFYCARLRLGIELDGAHHYSEDGLKYDEHRTEVLSAYGLTIIRFGNWEIRETFEDVCQMIESTIEDLQTFL